MDRDAWANKIGGKDIVERAYEKARFLIENHKPMALPEGAAATMKAIIKISDHQQIWGYEDGPSKGP